MSKLDAAGDITWQVSLGGSGEDIARKVIPTSDGGYAVIGTVNSSDGDVTGHKNANDIWLVKLTSAGAIDWNKTYGGLSNDWGEDVIQTTDGGYMIFGYTQSNSLDVHGNHGVWDYWAAKLNATGDTVWTKAYGGSSVDKGNAVAETSTGYVFVGKSESNDGDISGHIGFSDYWIVNADFNGDIIWTKILGGSQFEEAYAVEQAADGGFIVAGFASSNDNDVSGFHGGTSDGWVVKLSSTGTVEWSNALGGSMADELWSIQQTTSGGFIAAGFSFSSNGDVTGNNGNADLWMVKLDGLGAMEWKYSAGGSQSEFMRSVDELSSGNYIVAGSSSSSNMDVGANNGSSDLWLAKVSTWSVGIEENNENAVINIFPNPAIDQVTVNTSDIISVEILDVQGKAVIITNQKIIDVSHLPSRSISH